MDSDRDDIDELTWSRVLIGLAQLGMEALQYIVWSPIIVPVAIYQKVKSLFTPKPQHQGTVRPSSPINETKNQVLNGKGKYDVN